MRSTSYMEPATTPNTPLQVLEDALSAEVLRGRLRVGTYHGIMAFVRDGVCPMCPEPLLGYSVQSAIPPILTTAVQFHHEAGTCLFTIVPERA